MKLSVVYLGFWFYYLTIKHTSISWPEESNVSGIISVHIKIFSKTYIKIICNYLVNVC